MIFHSGIANSDWIGRPTDANNNIYIHIKCVMQTLSYNQKNYRNIFKNTVIQDTTLHL